MKISAKVEYACIAMFELAASHGSGEPVRIRHIADEHGIPSRFLVQILLQLKGVGLVASTRGASGGYQLARPPDEITLHDVMAVIEGHDEALTTSASAASSAVKVLHDAWQEVADVERRMLADVTLAELVERARQHEKNMYYI